MVEAKAGVVEERREREALVRTERIAREDEPGKVDETGAAVGRERGGNWLRVNLSTRPQPLLPRTTLDYDSKDKGANQVCLDLSPSPGLR